MENVFKLRAVALNDAQPGAIVTCCSGGQAVCGVVIKTTHGNRVLSFAWPRFLLDHSDTALIHHTLAEIQIEANRANLVQYDSRLIQEFIGIKHDGLYLEMNTNYFNISAGTMTKWSHEYTPWFANWGVIERTEAKEHKLF